MKPSFHDRKWPWLAALAVAGSSAHALAQQRYRRIEEPRWLKLRVTEVSAGIYAEGVYQDISFDNSGTSVTRDRLFVGPLLGLNLNGSVYHPNLVRFMMNSEGALGYAQETLRGRTTEHREQLQYLGRFSGNADILPKKDYRASIFGDYDHTYRDYDFFNRVTVDSWRYGVRAGYQAGPVPVTVNYYHRDEEVSDTAAPSSTSEDVLVVNARNERKSGTTGLSYTFNQYTRTDIGRTGEGTDHNVSLSDSEIWGSREQVRLNTTAGYTRRETTTVPTDQFTAGAILTADHPHNLSSYYDLSYDHFETGDFKSDNLYGRAELRHQLYESLTSTLIAQGANYEAEDRLSSGYSRRYGGGLSLSYTKRLSDSSRLRIDNTLMIEQVDQQGISTVENEPHTFAGSSGGAPPDSFFLNLPNVFESTIIITDENDSQPPYVLGLDYEVTPVGSRTLIQRPLGSRIPRDAIVLVDYRAEPTPAGSYQGLSEYFQVRLDLLNNLWGIYGRVNLYLNNAPAELLVQNLGDYVVGTDINWRWLRAGAEYELYDSDQSAYRAFRLFQSLSFNLDQVSSLGADFTQTWTEFIDADRREENYRFLARYRRGVSSRLRLDVEGGVGIRRGPGVDQTVATFRPSIDYVIGRTTINAGYNFEYELFLNNEERLKHMLFIRARRVF